MFVREKERILLVQSTQTFGTIYTEGAGIFFGENCSDFNILRCNKLSNDIQANQSCPLAVYINMLLCVPAIGIWQYLLFVFSVCDRYIF